MVRRDREFEMGCDVREKERPGLSRRNSVTTKTVKVSKTFGVYRQEVRDHGRTLGREGFQGSRE